MKESQIREHLNKGWIRAIITFEVVGKPAEHVESALAAYIENIKKDTRIIFLQEEREPALEHEDGMFSTFSESEMLVQDLETFTWLCINFSPASIEILEPDDLEIESREVTNWLNDLLSKIHEIGTVHRSQIAANEHLTIAMNQLIQNAILLSLKQGMRTPEDLEHDIGIVPEQLEPFLTRMAEKGKIVKSAHGYELPSPTAKLLAPQIPISTSVQVGKQAKQESKAPSKAKKKR